MSTATTKASSPVRSAAKPRSYGRIWEQVIHVGLGACASISVLTTIGIVFVLVAEAGQFFGEVSFIEFVTETRWAPLLEPQHFGILPLLCGTLWIALGSALFAVPVGLMSAIYLSEYASERVRSVVKPVLEILGGIPSVVFGYLAVVLIAPIIRKLIPDADVFNVVSASIAVGIMILPTVSSLSEDVLRAVPRSLREAAYGLGSTKFDVTVRVVFPAALSGIIASILLSISRAVGETMAVTLAAGATPKLTLNPLESIQTMTAYIVQVSLGDTPTGTIEYRTIFAVGLTLFVVTLVMNVLARWILARYRQVYV